MGWLWFFLIYLVIGITVNIISAFSEPSTPEKDRERIFKYNQAGVKIWRLKQQVNKLKEHKSKIHGFPCAESFRKDVQKNIDKLEDEIVKLKSDQAVISYATQEAVKDLNGTADHNKKANKVLKWYLIPVLIAVLFGLAYVIGWVWYYFCCGFLIFEDWGFWDKVLSGIMSLAFLAVVLGIVAIFCGWDAEL